MHDLTGGTGFDLARAADAAVAGRICFVLGATTGHAAGQWLRFTETTGRAVILDPPWSRKPA